MTLRKLLLTVLGFLLLPPGLCFAQVISQAQIMRFTYSNSPGTPPANSGYLYFNTSGLPASMRREETAVREREGPRHFRR